MPPFLGADTAPRYRPLLGWLKAKERSRNRYCAHAFSWSRNVRLVSRRSSSDSVPLPCRPLSALLVSGLGVGRPRSGQEERLRPPPR
eukprot:12276572-Alexandrium_andersonii.AAC.1